VENQQNIVVRQAQSSDVPVILDFILQLAAYEKLEDQVRATPEKLLESLFERKQAYCLLAYLSDKPVGFALYFYNYSTFLAQANLYLEDLFVLEDYRHRGVGKKLFQALCEAAYQLGAKRLDFSCLRWNKSALDFYSGIGALPMSDWVTLRMDEDAIKRLGS
jgi:GNAT superfamily N-acetyltransferase